MKNLFRLSLVAVLALSAVLTSCNKYEEGPGFTLLTAKMRVVNDWKITKVEYNGTDVTPSSSTTSTSIKKDNTYTSTYSSGSFSITENGTWEFNSDKTQLISTDSDGDVSTMIIVMLKNKMMKLKDIDGSNVTIVTYEPEV